MELTEKDKQFLNYLKNEDYVSAGNLLLEVASLSEENKKEYRKRIGYKLKYMQELPLEKEAKEGLYLMAIGCYLESIGDISLKDFVEVLVSGSDDSKLVALILQKFAQITGLKK